MFSQYGELRPTNGCDLLASLGHPANFNGFLVIGFVTTPTSLSGGQPNFAGCLAVSCTGILYIFFGRGALAHNGILPAANITLRPSLAFSYTGSVTARHSSTGVSQSLRHGTRNGITELSHRAPPIFGRAAITLGISPHSSFV